jgi:hypothetical protein
MGSGLSLIHGIAGTLSPHLSYPVRVAHIAYIYLFEQAIPDFLDLDGVITENPFHAAVQFSKEAVPGTYETGTNHLTRTLMALLDSVIEKQVMTMQAAIPTLDHLSAQVRNIELGHREAHLPVRKIHIFEQLRVERQKMVIPPGSECR